MALITPALLGLILSQAAAHAPASPSWKSLGDGIEYATVQLPRAEQGGDAVLHVVRVSPDRVELKAILASEHGHEKRVAGDWADQFKLTVAINAGMFVIEDGSSNTGYLRNGSHLNQSRWNPKYQSVLAFGGGGEGAPAAAMFDLDAAGARETFAGYQTVIQDLRLVKASDPGRGESVWKSGARKWSEAAIAADGQGHLLFFFSRTPMTMRDFNAALLALPLGIVRAMHAEGGPEASLSIRAPGLSLNLCGSYETGFNENDDNGQQWPIPNVIGVVAKKTAGPSKAR